MTRNHPISADGLPPGHWVARRGIQVWVPAPPARLHVVQRPTRRSVRLEAPPADLIALAAALGVHPDDLTARDRTREAADTRAIAAWILRAPGRSYPDIGRLLERDHTTIIHAVQRVNSDPALLQRAQAVTGKPADLQDIA